MGESGESKGILIEQHNLFKRDVELEKKLGNAFLDAFKKTISLDQLCKVAEKIRTEVVQRDSQGWDDRFSYLLLKDAIEELDTFHDDFTRQEYEQHPEDLLSYAQKLLGQETATFFIALPQRIRVGISYLKEE